MTAFGEQGGVDLGVGELAEVGHERPDQRSFTVQLANQAPLPLIGPAQVVAAERLLHLQVGLDGHDPRLRSLHRRPCLGARSLLVQMVLQVPFVALGELEEGVVVEDGLVVSEIRHRFSKFDFSKLVFQNF